MKKAILILFVLLAQFHFFSIAQTVEINDQPQQFVKIDNVVSSGDERWLLGGMAETNNEEVLYFKSVDSLSQVSVSTSFSLTQPITMEKFKVKGNAGYALVLQNNKRYIAKFSIFNSFMSFQGFSEIASDEAINNFEILPNGNLAAVGYKIINNQINAFLKILTGQLNIVFLDYSTPGYFSDVVVMPDSTFILTGGFGDNQIFGGRRYNQYYEQLGDIMEGIESDQFFPIENNGYLLLKDQTMTKLDNDFQIETSVDFESYGLMIDLAVDDENAFLLYQEEGAPPMILRINHSLEVEDFFTVEDENFRVKSMDVSEHELGLGGYLIPSIPFNNTPYLYPSTSGYFKTFLKNGVTENEDIDLAIIGATVGDHEKEFPCGTPGTTNSYRLNLKKIKVGLVNQGTKVINDVDLFVEVLGVQLCVPGTPATKYHTWNEPLSLLHLEPNDTLWWRISSLEFPQKIEDTTTVNICVWHTTVEGERDDNPDNDYFCGDVPLEKGYVELPIIEPTQGEYLLFPNPLKEKMTVSLLRAPFEPTVIEFYDYMGRELDLKYFIAARAKYKEFDIAQLPNGFYFLKISNDLFEELTRVYVD